MTIPNFRMTDVCRGFARIKFIEFWVAVSRQRKVWQLLIALILFISPCKLFSQDTCKYNKAGFSFQVGTGMLYGGGVGVLFEYQVILKENIWLTPLAGLGFSIGSSYPPDTVNAEGQWLNCAAGFNLEYGKKHRLIAGPQLIGANYISAERPTESIKKRIFFGYSCIIGYKRTGSSGIIWQLYAGVAHMQDPLMDDTGNYFEPHVGLGVGYKF